MARNFPLYTEEGSEFEMHDKIEDINLHSH